MILCRGNSCDYKPCENENICELNLLNCTQYEDATERYIIAPNQCGVKCKRDNPDFKGVTKQQAIEIYKSMPGRTTNVSISEFFEYLRMDNLLL